MDIRQIRYFHAVVEAGSLSGASDFLNVSQPAVGMQIRNLEEEFGLKLLIRHSRGIKTTPAGRVFFEHADKILKDIDHAKSELRRLRGESSGAIRIGVSHALASYLVPKLLELSAVRHPDMSLVFIQGFLHEVQREWESGNVDFTFTDVDLETETAESLPLFFEKFMLIGRPELFGDLSQVISLSELVRVPIVYDATNPASWHPVMRAAEAKGLEFENTVEAESIFLRKAYVLKRNHFTIAPSVFFHEEIAAGKCDAREIDLASLTRLVQLAGPRVERMTAAEHSVRQMIVDVVDATVEGGLYKWEKVRDVPNP